ncbi:hypothetical protein BKA67DRAFT_556147 [Truncatella angustata]|uniref:Rhodopsin domain-containing protein n=1 Tax=Truncatella angustata TaxID=152316 RepID=A0A9P9A155_9PEZI|nr:uncharacterized protein BKA67DRAFT_556147 [Truncatella angustata]KAH6657724.1 hypothetical protein BKA67DRAFT_556147 [Truncatella angustata]
MNPIILRNPHFLKSLIIYYRSTSTSHLFGDTIPCGLPQSVVIMVYHMDNFNPDQKRAYVISACSIGLSLSTMTLALRFMARRMVAKRLFPEDWCMLAGWICSVGIAAMAFMGFVYGMGEHEATVRARPNGKALIKGCLMSVWIIQRLYPPAHLFIKTSILLWYCRIFRTPGFKRAAWIIWGYTLLWSIHAQLASLLECLPPAYFYDRDIPGGHCVPNPLINISLTESVLNTLGDVAIFIMPMPMLKNLHVNEHKRMALYIIFAVGLLVNVISLVRWVSLLGTAEDITSSLPTASTWTYLEVAMAITCGNLPLLAPLFGSIFRRGGTHSTPGYASNDKSNTTKRGGLTGSSVPRSKRHSVIYPEEIMLQDRSNETLTSPRAMQPRQSSDSRRILVEDEIIVSYAQSSHGGNAGGDAPDKDKDLPPLPPAPTHASRAWAEI